MIEEDFQCWQEYKTQRWVFNKLEVAMKLGYDCGPAGVPITKDGYYIIRPIYNLYGMGIGAKKKYLSLKDDSEGMIYHKHIPPGYFWCEWFEGKHHSVDYKYGNQILAVRGYRTSDILTKWDKWEKVTQDFSIPPKLHMLKSKRWLNIEFIEDEVIEVHYRNDPDFEFNNKEFLPVWEGESINPPEGYTYIEHPDIHGRIGGFIR